VQLFAQPPLFVLHSSMSEQVGPVEPLALW
jgi:hypothetical protein